MTTPRRSVRCILVFLLLPILWSCAQMKGRAPEVTPPEPAVAAEPEKKTTPRKAVAAPAVEHPRAPVEPPLQEISRQANMLMEAGAYRKALDLYKAAGRKRPDDQAFSREYLKGVERIKSAADRALMGELFVSAGRTYDLLLERYPDFERFKDGLSFTSTDLDEYLSICMKTIAKLGFEEYRNGNLDQAIDYWQAFIEIEPDNAQISEVLATARLQRKNLEED